MMGGYEGNGPWWGLLFAVILMPLGIWKLIEVIVWAVKLM